MKYEIKNFAKILRNYENENFAATLLLHNMPSATHPPLPSARRFFNVVQQCYFEMKTNKEPCFSILSIIILCIQYTKDTVPRRWHTNFLPFHSNTNLYGTVNLYVRSLSLKKNSSFRVLL